MITIYIQHCNFYAFSTLLYIIFWIYCNTEEQGSTVSYILCMNKYWVSRNTINVFCGWIAWKQEEIWLTKQSTNHIIPNSTDLPRRWASGKAASLQERSLGWTWLPWTLAASKINPLASEVTVWHATNCLAVVWFPLSFSAVQRLYLLHYIDCFLPPFLSF